MQAMKHALKSILFLFVVSLCIAALIIIGIAIYAARSFLPLFGFILLLLITLCVFLLVLWLAIKVVASIPHPKAIDIGQHGTMIVHTRFLQSIYQIEEHRPLVSAPIPQVRVSESKSFIPSVAKLLADGSMGMGKLILGCSFDGSLRLGNWNDVRSFIVAGKSRSGKTVTMFFLVLQMLMNRAAITLCDPHYNKQTGLAHMLGPVQEHMLIVGNDKDIINSVMEYADELERRIAGEDISIPRVLVIDEWNRLIRHKDISNKIMWVIQAINQEGAGYNMFLVLGGQLVNPRAIGSGEILQSIHAAYVHHIDDKQSIHLLHDSKIAKRTPLLKVGVSLMRDTEGDISEMHTPNGTLLDAMTVAAYLKKNSLQIAAPKRVTIMEDN